MEIEEFVEMVKRDVQKKLGRNYEFTVCTADKNNGVVYTGLRVQKKGELGTAPQIYLNGYFERYKQGNATLTDAVDYVAGNSEMQQNVDMKKFMDYESVRKTIVYRLINRERNSGLLEDIPHVDFLDMAVTFHSLVSQNERGSTTILIHNTHLKLWDVTVEKLYQAAEENTQELEPYEIMAMEEVLRKIMEEECPESSGCDEHMTGFKDNVPMYVLSNKSRVGGAACILYPDLARDFAESVNSSFYIIPSSVHEVLLLPAENHDEGQMISSIIEEVNNTEVSSEEILSYSLYYYDKAAGKINKL